MEKNRIIDSYILKATIEANLQFSKENKTPFSLVKFAYTVDLEDAYKFKDLISFIYLNTNFSHILYQDNDAFLIFLKDTKILEAKAIIRKLNGKIENIGLTSSCYEDTYKTITDRVDKYFLMSKFSTKKKIFYGTKDFDFHDNIKPSDVIQDMLKKSNNITLNNIYRGIQISEEVRINGFSSGIMQIRIKQELVKFYQSEKFTFIKHDLLPDVIKANILKIDNKRYIMVLGNLEFISSSPIERSSPRITPLKKIHAILSSGQRKIVSGYILNISENSISMEIPEYRSDEKLNKSLIDKELNIQFQFINKKNFVSLVNIKADILSMQKNIIVLNIMPTSEDIERIKHYISLRQNEILSSLK